MSSQYYPPYNSSSNNIKVELDLRNYATKDDVIKVKVKKWIKGKKLFENKYTDYYNYCRCSLIYKNGNNFTRY